MTSNGGSGMGAGFWQIGEVAELTGLSLRTIRYYEHVGLLAPPARSSGGFRLYTAADVERLRLVKRMKPLEFTLEEMRGLLCLLDRLACGVARRIPRPGHDELLDRLSMYRDAAENRCATMREQLAEATDFARFLELQSLQLHRIPEAGERET